MAGEDCKTQFIRQVQKFREVVHVEGEAAYVELITELKEISCKFVDDLKPANVAQVVRSIRRRDDQHFKRSLTVRHEQQRYNPYAVHDEGWDEETEQLVTELFKLAGDASKVLQEIYKRVALLKSKVRQESFLKVIKAIPLPTTTITVLQRMKPELGLDVDKERICDHMPQPAYLEASPLATKLLGALTHFVMRNNLLQTNNMYSAKNAEIDFNVSYTMLKRVISGVKQKGGSFYTKGSAEKDDEEEVHPPKSRKPDPADKRATGTPAELEVEKITCQYCGKSYESEERWMKLKQEKHPTEKNIFVCPYCQEPYKMYIRYIDHLKEHQDKVIKCKTCSKVCKSLFALRQHIKKHVNQCPFCTENFSKSQELVSHIEQNHGEEPRVIERQCPYCDAMFDSIKEVTKHSQNVHLPHCCNICFMRFSEELKLIKHRQKDHKISNLGANVIISEPKKPSDQRLGLPTDTGDGAETSRLETGDPGNQMPGPWEQDKPQVSSEPATPKKYKVLKGHKKESEWYKVKCETCNGYFASIEEQRNHIKAYHQNRLKECTYCNGTLGF